ELAPVMDIGNHGLQTRLHDPEWTARQDDPLIIQAAHQHIHAAAFPAEYVRCRHAAVVEYQLTGVGSAHAKLVEFRRAGKTRQVAFDDERGDPARSALAGT